jgi:hypothetical protein
MTKQVIDAEFRRLLNDLQEEVEFCDEAGQTLGYFLPTAEHDRLRRIAEEHQRMLYAWGHQQFNEEELDRAEQDPEDFSTEEVLRDLEGR